MCCSAADQLPFTVEYHVSTQQRFSVMLGVPHHSVKFYPSDGARKVHCDCPADAAAAAGEGGVGAAAPHLVSRRRVRRCVSLTRPVDSDALPMTALSTVVHRHALLCGRVPMFECRTASRVAAEKSLDLLATARQGYACVMRCACTEAQRQTSDICTPVQGRDRCLAATCRATRRPRVLCRRPSAPRCSRSRYSLPSCSGCENARLCAELLS